MLDQPSCGRKPSSKEAIRFEPMVFEPWISSATVTGGGAALASGVGAVVGVDGGVIAAGGDGLVRKGAGVVAATTDATELGFGLNRYQAPTPIPQTKRAKTRSMGTRTFTGPLPAGVSGAPHSGHTNSAPSGI